ncbi:MAG: tRNA (adenosine(37)-N6)-dimethylallyltransferase MiaA [Deltaproteobacteria bacterium]|nr:tRNA (adenosine(37)-N6)-dimethylallyltransferase MiaA [Deltaproteobacteria bacterium]
MTKDKPKLLVILGPTAVGKSKLGIEIAKRIDGEIVNADSLQVYRYLNIGTAKLSRDQSEQVPHHLTDIVDPYEEFNAGIYRKSAKLLIQELHRKSTKIIIVGGTYLYVRVLLYGIIEEISANKQIRENLRNLKSTFGVRYVYERLKSLDPDSASRIHPNDYIRTERALEAYYLTGERMSDLREKHGFREHEFEVLKIGLFEDRKILRNKIDQRVDKMIEEGLVEEVKELQRMGFGKDLKPMQSIGYKQVNQYLDGEITLDSAIGLIKRDTKRLAKRQMTWLRSDKDIHWYHLPEDLERVINEAEAFYLVKS